MYKKNINIAIITKGLRAKEKNLKDVKSSSNTR